MAGLSGILVFVPQIMILFGLITLLEDTGYMARISFLTDRLMRSVGLNGKSVMPMISGFACAVPAIMSAQKHREQKREIADNPYHAAYELFGKIAGVYNFNWTGHSESLPVWISWIAGPGHDGLVFARSWNGFGRCLRSKIFY